MTCMCNVNQIRLDAYTTSNIENEQPLFITNPITNINGKYIHAYINVLMIAFTITASMHLVLTFSEYIFDKVDVLNKLNQHELLATNDHRDMQWIHCGARLDWRIIANGKGT